MSSPEELSAAQGGDRVAFDSVVTPHLRALKLHCYRMSGSWHEAEDLLQESLLRAWRGIRTFQGRSSVKNWLYAVTTRACLDLLEKRRERTLPFLLGPAADPSLPPGPPLADLPWLEPFPGEPEDDAVGAEALLSRRESVAFAFLTLVQKLPPRQRAVLLLRDVLGWQASACAELLETTVASVNSALQRARGTLGASGVAQGEVADERERELLGRYLRAWERAEVDSLLALLVEDATLAMPPMAAWYQGRAAIGSQLRAMAMPEASAGTRRFVVTRANGMPAVAVWRLDPASGAFQAEAIQVLELAQGRVRAITAFLDTRLFEAFGLPMAVDAADG